MKCQNCGKDIMSFREVCEAGKKHTFKYDANLMLDGRAYCCGEISLSKDAAQGPYGNVPEPSANLADGQDDDDDPRFTGISIIAPWKWPNRDVSNTKVTLKKHAAQGYREFKVIGTERRDFGDGSNLEIVTLKMELCKYPDTILLN